MGGDIRALHVDDQADFSEMVARQLENAAADIHVETTQKPGAVLEQLHARDFDCVVSDYDMPEMNGVELLRAVREEFPELPFILFTGKGSEEVASDAISAGVTDYLQKEMGTDQYALLANRIRNAVDHRRATRRQKRHLQAIETAREGISILNDAGEYIYVNNAYAALYGYTPEEMVGNHFELIYPDEEIEFARNVILPTVEAEGAWHGETTGLRANGDQFPEDHMVTKTDDGDLVCTVRDVTAEKERKAELQLKNRAMDQAPIGITISDPSQDDNPIIYANSKFESITGYDQSEILGRNCRFLQGEGTDPQQVEKMRTAIDNRDPVTVELRNYRKDGTAFWNRVTIAPLENSLAEVTHFVGFQEELDDN